MQRLEVTGTVQPLYESLGVKGLNMAVPIETSSFKLLHQYMYRLGSEALCRSVIPKTAVVVVVVAVVEKTWSASYSAKDTHTHTCLHILQEQQYGIMRH